MDISATYFTILSRSLALQSLILIPIFMFTALFVPKEVAIDFPPPLHYSGNDRKIVRVPTYPPAKAVGFLIVVYLGDIICLYPFTQATAEKKDIPIISYFGIIGLILQTMATIGWSGMRPSWLAAQYQHGLWHSKKWTVYYMSFIINGIGIGISVFILGYWLMIRFIMIIMPIIREVFYYAYIPLKFW